jgi:Peptidase family M28
MSMDVTDSGADGPRARRLLPRLATCTFLIVVGGMALASGRPPDASPVDVPDFAFSAARAMRHVEAIARQPHPLGSAAAEPVRAYIVDELKKLGLEPQIQRPRDAREQSRESESDPERSDVVNIVARWRGTGPSEKKALLLSAHYDSVRRGPGAGDDASGVAAILEGLRALKAMPPLERDIIVLINDGEEVGLYGADVFAAEHPWAKDVGVVLNFEGRGNSGPSFMFETSDGNGWLIEQLARGSGFPMASSMTYEVYRLMPNDTDLTVYKRYGMAGFNFAFVGGLAFYHSPEDTPANLDPRTLQHQGVNLVGMALRLGGLDLDDVRRADVVYFSILQRFMMIYPMSWVMPLLGLAVLAYIGVVALGLDRRRIRLAEVAAGFATFLAAAPAAVLAVEVLWLALGGLLVKSGIVVNRPDLGHGRGMPVSRYDVALLAGSAVVAVLVAASIFAWSARRWSWEGLGLGALLWWVAAAAATSLQMPGASYAFVWPLLAILLGQAMAFLVPRGSPVALVASWLGAVPLLVLQLMIIDGVFNGLNIRMAPFLMIPVVLVAAALVPVAAQVLGGRAASDSGFPIPDSR